MNAQELYLDVSSGRFLDGKSTIPTNKPYFYSNEKRSVRLNAVKVENNQIIAVTPSLDSRYKMRLGTTSQKLVDATDAVVVTANAIQATGSVSTLPCLQAIGVAASATYSPITAQFSATITTLSSVTASFTAKLTVVSTVAATITATITSAFYPTEIFSVPIVPAASILDRGIYPVFGGLPSVLTMTPILNSPVSASFSCFIANGEISGLVIQKTGDGYIDGTYPITVSGGNPTVTALIYATANDGYITSVSIVSAGVGYASVPSLSLFTPNKAITSVCVSNYLGDAGPQNPSFSWITPITSGITIPLIFSFPTASQSQAANYSATGILRHINGSYWSAEVSDGGYGYESTASVTHGSFQSRQFIYNPDPYYNTPFDLVVRNGSFGLPREKAFIGTVYYYQGKKYGRQYLGEQASTTPGPYGAGFGDTFEIPKNSVWPTGAPVGTIINVAGDYKTGELVYIPVIAAGGNSFPLADSPQYLAIVPVGSKRPEKYAVIEVGRETLRFVDLGQGYGSDLKSWEFVPLTSLKEGPAYSTLPGRSITEIAPPQESIAANIVRAATIQSSNSDNSDLVINVSDGGFGYIRSSQFELSAITLPASLKSVKITNNPIGYNDGIYPCTVSGGGGGGAKVDLIFQNNYATVSMTNAGSGYTSVPDIVVSAPNVANGYVSQIILNNTPSGYMPDKPYFLSLTASPSQGGSAYASFTISSAGIVSTNIDAPGFGYVTTPIITSPQPDVLNSGYVSSLILQNSPQGYSVGQEYNLTIQASPNSNGSAKAKFTKTSSVNYSVEIIDGGFGYTSAPIVTAPSPDAPQGYISSVAPVTFGRGFLAGTYPCSVPTSPSNKNAIISLVVTTAGESDFVILNPGGDYTSSVTVSVATPNGNVLNQITISCAGSFYPQKPNVMIEDVSGYGQVLGTPIVSAGKILSIQVINGGSNFSNNPKVVFSVPTIPIIVPPQENAIDGDFVITTTSANAILSGQSSQDILFELYETNGTDEQVISQAVVGLAKRVPA